MIVPSASLRLRALLALSLGILGCGKKDPVPSPAVPVVVATAERRAVPYEVAAAGTVEPLERVNVEAQVSGQLLRIGFHEGDVVRQGQVLFEIDSRPYRAVLDQAQAILAKDMAQSQNADRDLERYAALVKQEYVTAQQFESTRATAQALRATVQADSAALETARLNYQYATIRAPISGLAGSLQIREGNLVRGPGSTLVTLNQIRPILVRFTVSAANLPEIRRRPTKDVEVVATLPGGAKSESGRLNFLDNAIDTTTGTILLKARFENADGALWPGQFVSVTMQLYVQPDALVVPAVAILTGQLGTSVFVVDSAQAARPRMVRIARTAGDVVVIDSGLVAGERVVTAGQLRLVPGSKVELKPIAAAAAEEKPK